MRSVQEIFGRYVLVEQLDGAGIESWLGVGLEARDTDAHVVVRRVPLWLEGRDHFCALLKNESEMRALGTERSLPRFVDRGSVGDVPFLAYAYVPGVTVAEVLDAMEKRAQPPMPPRMVMATAICLSNAMHALSSVDASAAERAHFHPGRVVLPFDTVPVLLGVGQDGAPSRQGMYGLANLLFRMLTGHRALSAGERVPAISSLNPETPQAFAELLTACLDGRFTEFELGRFVNGVDALLSHEEEGSIEEMHGWLASTFPRQRHTWETRRLVHGRLRRRLRHDSTPPSDGMAKVVQVHFPRRATPPATTGRLSFEELFADVQEDAAWFLREDTGDTEIETVQEVPVSWGVPAVDTKTSRGHVVRTRDGREMVRVPAGVFVFGTEGRLMMLEEYFIDRFPVTNGEYARFVGETGHKPPAYWKGRRMPKELAGHPVVQVGYDDALAFARWAGKDLPTEEQWEKAARGTQGWLWPHGSRFDAALVSEQWRHRAQERVTTAIGGFSPRGDSPFGLGDIGHQWEWTRTPVLDKDMFVVRGGVWRNRQEPAQVINRSHENRAARDVGFRCVALPMMMSVIRVD